MFDVPASELPAAVAEYGPRIQHRTGVLVRSTGLVPPLGTLPSGYVGEQLDTWAVGALGGSADILEDDAAIVVASQNDAFSRQVQMALRAAKLKATRTSDVTGTELASCAGTAAAVAAAAAAAAGPDAQDAAARQVLAELDAFARRTGSKRTGLGSTDELVGTAVARERPLPAVRRHRRGSRCSPPASTRPGSMRRCSRVSSGSSRAASSPASGPRRWTPSRPH